MSDPAASAPGARAAALRATAEGRRLTDSEARRADWKHWGPYVSERAWGTVREDYSANGDAWRYFPHDHARSRAYRWNEDGLAGFCNRFQNACLGLALWNGRDAMLKERLFGLGGHEGNHGEDVKEYYFYEDGLPSHAYMAMTYRYPQVAYPYDELVAANARASRLEPEVELVDVLPDVFREHRFFDVRVEYAKAGQEDVLCRITAVNHGPEAAPLHVLPHVWFRNTWSWGYKRPKPHLRADADGAVRLVHKRLGTRWWWAGAVEDAGVRRLPLLFTENDTNTARLWGVPNAQPYVKDAFHEAVVQGRAAAVNPAREGTKAAAHAHFTVPAGGTATVLVRFSDVRHARPFEGSEALFATRQAEADAFYDALHPPALTAEERRVQRQAIAGLLWTKQFYHYNVELWLRGDPAGPPPPAARWHGRNSDWEHLHNLDVLSMPDAWEYPWYAAWDLAFHMLPTALVDPEWAKRQLVLLLREWYMHPNGQIPAYEWSFSDVNPPVHAWAAWRVYEITRAADGTADTDFLERVFHKLLLNFTWWVNRKDAEGRNVFQGGFLGLDNIGVFDRSKPLPGGGLLDQADGTAWMALYCLNMLTMALELAQTRPAYEDVATKFFEHFVYIAHSINSVGGGLWNEEDGFYYDALRLPGRPPVPLRIRSFVGLIPLFAVCALDPALLKALPRFRRRLEWFRRYRPHLLDELTVRTEPGPGGRGLLALLDEGQVRRVLRRMLDEAQFLSPYGLRSLSKEHAERPFTFRLDGSAYTVRYEPAESETPLFGGNSNWRGPVWWPTNYLMIESLRSLAHHYGDAFTVELPAGSGHTASLDGVADELSRRLVALFLAGPDGRRPFWGDPRLADDACWRDRLLFHEYFHGDTGAGLGASHQTGWTALVATLLQGRGGAGPAGTP